MKRRITAILLILTIVFLSACSVSKSKDFSKYPNLLIGTNNGTENFKILDKGYNAIFEAEGDGVKVISTAYNSNKDGGDGWLALFYDDGHSREVLAGPEGDIYSLVFEAKTNVKDAKITIKHKQENSKETQIDFGTAIIKKANKWTQITLTSTLKGVAATSQGLYIDLSSNPAGTEISIRNLKLVKEG